MVRFTLLLGKESLPLFPHVHAEGSGNELFHFQPPVRNNTTRWDRPLSEVFSIFFLPVFLNMASFFSLEPKALSSASQIREMCHKIL